MLVSDQDNKMMPAGAEVPPQNQYNLLMQAPAAIAVFKGADFIVELANDRMLELWDKSLPEVLNKPIFEAYPQLRNQGFEAQMQQVMQEGKGLVVPEIPVRLKQEESELILYVKLAYEPLRDYSNNIIGIMVIAHEITGIIEDRRKLEVAETRSRLAIEATGLGTFDWDLRTQKFVFSERLAGIFGCTVNDFNHNDLINRIHPEDRYLRDAAVKASFDTGYLNYRVRLVWPDQSLHWVSVYGKVSYDENHSPVKMYGTALDISLERNYQNALEESEKKFRSLANFLPTFIWTTDPNGRLTYFNKAILEFSGLSEYEMEQGGWLQLLHPEDRAINIRRLEKAIVSGKDFNAELRIKNRNGDYRWQMGRSVALRDPAGSIQMWIGTSIDIHDQKMMAEELEKRVRLRTAELKLANEELIRTNQELEQFAYVSSHDLQEPLRKIQTFSDLVLKRVQTDEHEIRLHLEKISASANRMSILINDLLNYSRISKSDENFAELNLNRVLDNILNDFEVLINQKEVIITAENLPVIRGIPFQINQLFYNLISNALKFSIRKPVLAISSTEVDGESLPEDIPLPHNKKYLRLTFKDNGIGFEQIYASQIFTIFQRLNNRNHYSGTGIGLAICKKIVENHDGYISATSVLNEGAMFTVYLAM